MAFRVGQKVECIDDGAPKDKRLLDGYWIPNWPVKGQIYTVRGVNEKSITVEEIINPVRDFGNGRMEGHFLNFRFRPLITRKTDISIFTAMLGPRERVGSDT